MVTVNNPTGTVMAISERAYRDCARRAAICSRRATLRLRISDGHCIITGISFFSFLSSARRRIFIGNRVFFRIDHSERTAGYRDRECASRIPYVLHVNNTRLLRFRSLRHVPLEIRVLFPSYRF